jgi:hypothetical protein
MKFRNQHPENTWRPYGKHKWRRMTAAHRRCSIFTQPLQKAIQVRSSRKKAKPIMHFDTESYDDVVDSKISLNHHLYQT